jgi:hypothetical protein
MATVCNCIMVTVADEVGKLAQVTDLIQDAGLNILALVAWVEGDKGKLLAHTDDNEKACAAVSGSVQECGWKEGICVTAPNTPGALGEIARKLADAGISIELVYATVADGPEAAVILHTSDNARAAEIV